MSMLKQTIGGLHFSSPLIVASSPLTDSLEKIKLAEDHGAGGVSVKFSMHTQLRPGVRKMYWDKDYFFNPSDRRFTLDQGAELTRRARETTALTLFANISGHGAEPATWIEAGTALAEAGAHALELNFACPNLASGPGHAAPMSADAPAGRKIVEALKNALNIPVWVKFSGESIHVPTLAKELAAGGADGLTAFASPRGAFPIDIDQGGIPKIPGLAACSFGGVNGPTLRPICNRVVAESALSAGVPVMGGGGIRNWRHAVECLMFGASLFFMCSKLLTDGFPVIADINAHLRRFMEDKGYGAISDMRGLALRHVVPPSELDYAAGPKARVDSARCSGCGTCARIGSCFAIRLEGKKAVVDAARCESCGLCASLCPNQAIFF